MRLTSLRLTDVKRHAFLEVDLAAGLTVIRGPNEAGKTTVQRALEMALFRRPTSTAAETESVRPWGRPEADPKVELRFEHDGLVGRVTKVFAGSHGTAELELDGEVHTDPAHVDRRLAELTGLPSEKFFRSTACIRQSELADLDGDEGALRDRLQQSMSGADRGTWGARRKLQEAIARYRAEGVKNPGPLKQARDTLARLAAEAATGEAALAALGRDRSALAHALARRESLDAEALRAEEQLDAAERAVAARDRLGKADGEYRRYRRAAELHTEIAAAESSQPSSTPVPVLRSGVERLRGLESRISELRAELATPQPSQWQGRSPGPSWRPATAIAFLLLVAAVAAAVGLGGTVGLVVGAVFLAGAVATALFAMRLLSRASQVDAENEMLDRETPHRLHGRSDVEERVRAMGRERDAQLAMLGLVDLASAEALLAEQIAHNALIDRLRAEYRGLLGHASDVPDPLQDPGLLRDRVAATADEARHVLGGMGEVGADPGAHLQRAEAALRRMRAEREAALAAEAGARARVESNAVDAEMVAATVERLAATRAALASHERRSRVYETALAALDAAEQATMQKAARFLELGMGTDVALITGGRYRRVRVDENDLRFAVFSAEAGDWVDVRALSRGTIDQVYLAARLGLVRQVTQGRRPPLIFDDPFVTFDDERARRSAELLKRLASDHQVIYLTCSERYDEVADRVIELPSPIATDLGQDEPAEPTDGTFADRWVQLIAETGAPSAARPEPATRPHPVARPEPVARPQPAPPADSVEAAPSLWPPDPPSP